MEPDRTRHDRPTKVWTELLRRTIARLASNAIPWASTNRRRRPMATSMRSNSNSAGHFPACCRPETMRRCRIELKNLANIQCENCHGPGSRHPGSPSISLDVKVCASCHQNGTNHVRPEQWEISPHAGAYENIATSRGINPQCARCHSPLGFMDVAKGIVQRASPMSIRGTRRCPPEPVH